MRTSQRVIVDNDSSTYVAGDMSKKPIRLADIPLSDLEPSPEHIALVREEVVRLGRQRTVWIGMLNSLEQAANLEPTKFDVDQHEAPPASTVMRRPPREGRIRPTEQKPMMFHQGSWADTIYTALTEAGRPLSFAEIKEAMSKTPLGPKMNENKARSYYSTIQRMKADGHVVDYKGGVTTPDTLKRFLAEVEAGRVVDVEHARYRNKYAEAIYRYLKTMPAGASVFEIMEHLKTVPDLNHDSKHLKSYMLTIMHKLVSQSKSVKRIRKGTYILVEFLPDSGGSNSEEAREVDETLFETAEAEASAVH